MALEPHQHAAEVDRLHICRACLTRRQQAECRRRCRQCCRHCPTRHRCHRAPLSAVVAFLVCSLYLLIVSNFNGSPHSQVVLRFQVLHFPPLTFGPAFSGPAFSAPYACFESWMPLVNGCINCAFFNAVPNVYIHNWNEWLMQQTNIAIMS